ncbi:hypothetical protein [Spirosoma rigui]|uniref:hypothetical protein n=1 Tax=Spirosoma rigui TaxID=564064 RepID=UPI0012D332AB|nr:hypothetical protein [Spirosoma rigui]
MGTLVIALIIFVVVIFVLRAVGAWMLRIDEVIKNQKIIIEELKNINQKPSNTISTM